MHIMHKKDWTCIIFLYVDYLMQMSIQMGNASNLDSKALYIAVKPLENTVKDNCYGIKYNCLVFDPLFDRTNNDAMKRYNDFFQNTSDIKKIPVITEQDPVELAKTLVKKYGAVFISNIGGIIAPIHIPQNSVSKLVQDLTRNPMEFFTSEEKIMQESYFF
jgi:hypothetical protein